MGLLAKLRRHGLLTVCAALALWVAEPALTAFCPCVSVAVADTAAVDSASDPDCCRGCCSPAAMVRQDTPVASPLAAVCPLKNADFSPGAVVSGVADVAVRLSHAIPGVVVAPHDFLLGLSGPLAGESDASPPGPTLPRALARLVAARCHPIHAPPVS